MNKRYIFYKINSLFKATRWRIQSLILKREAWQQTAYQSTDKDIEPKVEKADQICTNVVPVDIEPFSTALMKQYWIRNVSCQTISKMPEES